MTGVRLNLNQHEQVEIFSAGKNVRPPPCSYLVFSARGTKQKAQNTTRRGLRKSFIPCILEKKRSTGQVRAPKRSKEVCLVDVTTTVEPVNAILALHMLAALNCHVSALNLFCSPVRKPAHSVVGGTKACRRPLGADSSRWLTCSPKLPGAS